MIWTKEQAKALTDRVLGFSKAEETQVVLTGGDRANVRFARNSVTTVSPYFRRSPSPGNVSSLRCSIPSVYANGCSSHASAIRVARRSP